MVISWCRSFVITTLDPSRKARLLIAEKTFQEQMRYLKSNGFRTVTLTEYYEFLTQKRQLPRKTVVITFDDGYKSFLRYAYPALKEVGFTATLFVYTDYVGAGGNAFSWAELKRLADEGFQVEAHSKTHGNLRRAANEPANSYQNRLRAELEAPLGLFQKNIGRSVQFLAYPYGAQDDQVVERTKSAGYLAAFTVRPQSSYAFIDPYRIHRVQIFSEMKLDDFAGYPQHLSRGRFEMKVASAAVVVLLFAAALLSGCATTPAVRLRVVRRK